MKKLLVLVSVLLNMCFLNAQTSNQFLKKLPFGYQLADSNGEAGPSIENDFDGDGLADLAVILFSENADPVFCIFLASTYSKTQTFKYCSWVFMMHDLNYENGILNLSSNNGSMPIFGEMSLKYDKVTQEMKIIKYEDSDDNKTIKFQIGKL